MWFLNKFLIEEMVCMVVIGIISGEFIIEKNVYFIVFQRGFEKSKFIFEKYYGIFNEIYSK